MMLHSTKLPNNIVLKHTTHLHFRIIRFARLFLGLVDNLDDLVHHRGVRKLPIPLAVSPCHRCTRHHREQGSWAYR